MILLTVGTQLPFDRLVNLVDIAAGQTEEEVIGQVGKSSAKPMHFSPQEHLDPRHFELKLSECRVVVSHAGIGSILSARRHHKPIILLARRAALGEHRNDHQLATCMHLGNRPGIYVAEKDEDVVSLLARRDLIPAPDQARIGEARYELTRNISQFIDSAAVQ